MHLDIFTAYTLWITISVTLVVQPSPVFSQSQCSDDLTISVNPDADVKFTVMTSLRNAVKGKCGTDINVNAWRDISVMEWVVNKMNDANFTDVVKIGFDVIDTCGLPRKSLSAALHVLDGPVLGTASCGAVDVCNIGIIGPSESESAEAAMYAASGSQLPVVSPYATSRNLTRFSNFFRTLPSDDQIVEGVLAVLKSLGLTYVAVVHEDSAHARDAAFDLRTRGRQSGICVDTVIEIKNFVTEGVNQLKDQRGRTKDGTLRVVYFGGIQTFLDVQRNLDQRQVDFTGISWLIVKQPENNTQDYDVTNFKPETILFTISNENVSEVYDFVWQKFESVNQASVANDDPIGKAIANCTGSAQKPLHPPNAHFAPVIDALFVMLNAFQRQFRLHCRDPNALCKDIREEFNFMSEVLKFPVQYADLSTRLGVTVEEFAAADRFVNFSADGDLLLDAQSDIFDVWFIESQSLLNKIGVIRSSGLNLTLTPDVVISESRCGATCPACVETPEVSFAFIEGDTYLLGIISAHETEADFPFQCTQDLRSMDVLVVEAFLNTVNMSSNGAGLKLGAIVLDDCYSSARMELILTKLMSGETLLTNPNNKEPLNIRDKVAAVVMTVSSTVTKVVATLMAEFGIPVISASASSPDLDDRVNFPYFLRKVVSDVEQARAMVKIVKRMGWQYVSMLYVTNNYGSKGKEAFVEEAAKNGICVADKVEGIPDVDVTDSSLLELYTRIQNHKTDVVVYFGTEARIKEFLELINTNLPFVFLASEDWGDNRHILDQGRNKSLGSLTMKNEVNDIIADEFKQYLTQLSPSTVNMSRNPWLAEYWEDGFQCDLDSSITNKYSEKCQNGLRLSDTNISDAIIDQRILHTIDAIRAVFVGVLEAKNEFCSFENTFPCQLYDNERHVTKFVSFIRNARLLRNGQKTRVFNDDGNGNTGFDINNVQRDSNGLYYRNVGSFKHGFLSLNVDDIKFYRDGIDGKCTGNLCDHCGNETAPTTTMATVTHAQSVDNSFAHADYAIIGILGFLFIVIVVLCLSICCYFRRRVKELQQKLMEVKHELRTGYSLQNGSAISAAHTMPPYPEKGFLNPSPSGETMYEFNKTNAVLNGGGRGMVNGGIVNRGFVGDMYIHARSDDDPDTSASSNQVQSNHRRPMTQTTTLNDIEGSPGYRPPSSHYGRMRSNSSFKRTDNPHNAHNAQIKKQPRTQLAVPPCRPELPPRDADQPKIQQNQAVYPEQFEQFESASPTVPKDKIRNGWSNSKRAVSSPTHYDASSFDASPTYKDSAARISYSPPPQYGHNYNRTSPTETMDLNASMEKISRV